MLNRRQWATSATLAALATRARAHGRSRLSLGIIGTGVRGPVLLRGLPQRRHEAPTWSDRYDHRLWR